MKRGGHDGEGPLEPGARQLRKMPFVGKARRMHDSIDRAKRGARCRHEVRRRARRRQIAAAPLDPGAGALAVRHDRFQPLDPGGIGALSMQHQALIASRQSPRDGSADPGSAAGNDGCSHDPVVLARLT